MGIVSMLIGALIAYLLTRTQKDLAVFENDLLDRLNGRYIRREEGLYRFQALELELTRLRERSHDLYNVLHRHMNQTKDT